MRVSAPLYLRLSIALAVMSTIAWAGESRAAPRVKPRPPADCAAEYRALAPPPGAAAKELAKQIENRFAGLDLTWQEGKKRGPRLEKFLNNLLALTPEEKPPLLAALHRAFPDIEEAPLLARIGFNEDGGWKQFFRKTWNEPTHYPPMLGDLRLLVESMPEPTRLDILAEIGGAYPRAGKLPEGMKDDGRFYPKRLLDGWLRVLMKGDDIFRAEIAAGKKPAAAYQTYLDEIRRLVFKNAPPEQLYAQLSVKDILALARETQAFLKRPTTMEKLYMGVWDENRKLLPPLVRFFGSLVKGTSRRGSDVDSGYFNLYNLSRLSFLAGGERDGVKVAGLAPLLEARMEKLHPGFGLRAHGNPHALTWVDQMVTSLEPFMIEVSPDKVEILVFSREITPRKVFTKARTPPIYQAPAPTRYRLD